jgi:CubicO group peptidase (beta-lactamase class C family)
MPRQDQKWIMSGGLDTPAERVFTMLAPMKPTSGFGEMFQYSNLLASAAGYIAGRVEYPDLETGAAYDKARLRFFGPLKMKDSTFSKDDDVAGNHADPHEIGPGDKVVLGTIDKSDSIYFARPAGAPDRARTTLPSTHSMNSAKACCHLANGS